MKLFNKKAGIEQIKQRYCYYFIWPWLLGVLIFVLIPIGTCFYFSLSEVRLLPEGLSMKYVGSKFYHYLFVEDADYLNMMMRSLSSVFSSLPIVVALSMILAIILNQKFKGRTFARAVFFSAGHYRFGRCDAGFIILQYAAGHSYIVRYRRRNS